MIIEQIVGAALMLLFLADIFLTALYARAGTGLLAPHWTRAAWAVLRGVAKLSGRRRVKILTFAGPLIVVSLVGFWAIGLTIGAALVIQPELGSSIRPSSGESPTDFITALLVAGNSLSIVGGGDYSPHSAGTRLLFLANSLIGASVLSLVLSYLVQIYSALRERNALALAVDLMTDGTGDAAVMLARLMPNGDSADMTSELGNLIRSLAATKEAHHFYPLLFYFRFEEPLYAVSRFSFVLLDATTLISTALDQRRYPGLAASAPVASIRRGAQLLLDTLDSNFPTAGERGEGAAEEWRLRQSYLDATRTLETAGIVVHPDRAGAYVSQRQMWEPLISRVAPTLGYSMREIDARLIERPNHAAKHVIQEKQKVNRGKRRSMQPAEPSSRKITGLDQLKWVQRKSSPSSYPKRPTQCQKPTQPNARSQAGFGFALGKVWCPTGDKAGHSAYWKIGLRRRRRAAVRSQQDQSVRLQPIG